MKFCDCEQDGWCERYQRLMTGRFREICRGVNCDLGSAAAFRAQWARDASAVTKHEGEPTKLILKTEQAPGDAVAMTAAIYSLHKAHPGKFVTAVESPYPEVFAHNPDVAICPPTDAFGISFRYNWHPIHMHYPAIHDSNERGIHFMQGWCEFLGMALGIEVPLLTNRPRLYFDSPPPKVEDYWVVCSGGKPELSNKLWGQLNYQRVTAMLAKEVRFVQVGANQEDHPKLNGTNVVDMVGKTNLRQLFELIRRARGVLCGVSLPMHIAAALEKPGIIIAGGREPVQWNAYPRQHYLHTVGMLPCTSRTDHRPGVPCWRSRIEPATDDSVLGDDVCQRPCNGLPECMTLIKPESVADLLLQINRNVYEPKEAEVAKS